ncbi:MAG TPA: Lrp/AsnC family transcriptional regulator [Anaerolineales bacterium]|jgi:Lrp/AsnC family transcriptional regulator for asnA, asnC and gidA|nr:Lrp/AsnC family transcriptional regulator [Anaerolineales bacterium]
MLDETDRAIVSYLQYDGRMPYTKIATELGITEGGIRRRVKKMTDEGVLQIVGIVKPHDIGLEEASMIGVMVEGRPIDAVAGDIAQFPEVTYLFQAAGEFDLFVEVYCQDREHFVEFLNNTLQRIPGVRGTQSFLILKMYKLSYRWGDAPPLKKTEKQSALPVAEEN